MKNNRIKKILRSTLIGAIAATMCFGMNVFAAPQESSAADKTDATATIVKTLNVPLRAPTPNATFAFHFTSDPVQTGMDADQIPAIGSAYVYYKNVDPITKIGKESDAYGVVNKAVQLPVSQSNYQKPGDYYYTVTEQQATGNSAVDKDMQYDDSTYEMLVSVRNKDVNDAEKGMYIAGIFFQKVQKGITPFSDNSGGKVGTTPKFVDGKFINGYNLFTNAYTPFKDVSLKELVEGNMADKNKEFTYDVTINYPGIYDNSNKVTITGDTDTVAFTNGETQTLTLKHGDEIIFKNVPVGSTFQIEESDTGAYKTNVTTVNGIGLTSKPDGDNTDIEFATPNEEGNNITVINTLNGGVVTGVVMNNIPFVVLIGAGVLAIAGYFVSRRRKANR